MTRRYLALVLVAVLVLSLALPSMAAGRRSNGIHGRFIHAVRSEAGLIQYWVLEWKVARANNEIERLVKHAQNTPYDDVAWLVRTTNAIAAEVVAYAESIGATVECEYTEYLVDGQYVLIDPLRVVDLGKSTRANR